LFYIAGEYQKLVDNKSLYSSALQKIPAPNFIVFYKGRGKCYIGNVTGNKKYQISGISVSFLPSL
jgi:hypothetical protein